MNSITPDVISDIATGVIKPIDAFHLMDELIDEATVVVNRTNNAEGPDSEEHLCGALKTNVLTIIRNICDELLTVYSDITIHEALNANSKGGLFTVDQAPGVKFRWYLTAHHDLSDGRKKGLFADQWRTWDKFQKEMEKFVAEAKYFKRDAVMGYIEGDPDFGIPGHENYIPAEERIHVDCLSAKIFEESEK